MRRKVYLYLALILLVVLYGCGERTHPGTGTYVLDKPNINDNGGIMIPYIEINSDDNTFYFFFDMASSNAYVGNYEWKNNQLVLKTFEGEYTYVFDVVDQYKLSFKEKSSDSVKLIDKNMGIQIEDGDLFVLGSLPWRE